MSPAEPTIIHITQIGSTNTELMRRLASAEVAVEALPLWLVADVQTAGRGRQGRSWTSEPGNLFASLAINSASPPEVTHQLAMVAGLAVHDTITRLLADTPHKPRLKWPNDVLVNGAKIAGILCEATRLGQNQALVGIIGIGLNLVQHPNDLEKPATSVRALCGQRPLATDVLALLSKALMTRLDEWAEARGFGATRAHWLEVGHTLGEALTVHSNAPNSGVLSSLTGHFAGLDVDGALLLEGADGEVLRITFGDVSAVKPPSA